MIRFTIGTALPFVAIIGLFVYRLMQNNVPLTESLMESIDAGLAFGFCILASSFVVTIANYRRPRQLFQNIDRKYRRVLVGLMTGVIALFFAVPGIVFLEDHANEQVLLGASGLLAGFLVSLFLRKTRPGVCLGCGFDLRASLDRGRCPECGRGIQMAV